MKSLLLIMTLLFSTSLMAEGGEKWKERRDAKVSFMTERAAEMQKNIECLKAAATKDAFKACKDTIKSQRKAWQEKRKNKKK